MIDWVIELTETMASAVERFALLHREGSLVISQAIEQEEAQATAASSSRADIIALYWRGIALLDQALALQFTHSQW